MKEILVKTAVIAVQTALELLIETWKKKGEEHVKRIPRR
jgi:hypothetical protein